ncbi:hypothetical protein NDK47_23865 [Brevibacillus ruminantium]|uniref:Helicase ATP-binding domain-containing protein n=1 Tax=Brevibacillus ruminantium TaxID=2950604 RepID=A0ABY4WG69_9BACL|nr:hypothetical protein [Brevibacillus ruminantium]USG65123.1 hypothetical protein NDK47_23865 [Brevibacillus ruminantium]
MTSKGGDFRQLKVNVSLDKVGFNRKPEKQEIAGISSRLGISASQISIQDFAKEVVCPNARSFSPSIFKSGERTNATWVSQQIFALDIDEDISIQQVLERCNDFNLMPIIIYTSFRSTKEHEKFRVIFLLDEEVTDIRVRDLVQKSLMFVFPETDRATKDAARLLFGGKEIAYENYDNIITVPGLLTSVCAYIRTGSNPTRDMEKYCRFVGIDMVNGYPKIQTFENESEIAGIVGANVHVKLTKNWTNPIIYNRICPIFSQNYILYFSKDNAQEHYLKTDSSKDTKFNIEKTKEEFTLIRNFNFDELEDNCQLFREALSGDYWLYHEEMFGLMTNLLHIKGGKEKVQQILNSRKEYARKIDSWNVMANQISKCNYAPSRCDSFCPFADSCQHARNVIDQGKLVRGRVQVLEEEHLKSLPQAEKELEHIFTQIIENEEEGIYVIKAPTGIGKTELYVQACKQHKATIALPTHALKDEVSNRMKESGVRHFTVPQLPDNLTTEVRQKLEHLYSLGAFKTANVYLRDLAKEFTHQGIVIDKYIRDIESAKTVKNTTILTTHQRAIYTKDHNDILIVDEDIIPTLFPQSSMSLADFTLAIAKLKQTKSNQMDIDVLSSLEKQVMDAPIGLIQEAASFFLSTAEEMEQEVVKSDDVNTNILGFLNCTYYVKVKAYGEIEFINFISRKQLPAKKVIIMSATINERISKIVFGQQIKFYDLGLVETKGKIIQIPSKSFSRYSIKENKEEMLNLAENLINTYNPNSQVITYKNMMKTLEQTPTFGATAGVDYLKGQNITILGTPNVHPLTYLLFSAALGQKLGFDDSKMEYQPVIRNGFKFYYQTYSNKDLLKEIQFYLIESELLQAVGRARILRTEATVLVLSNLPIQGAEFVFFNKQQLDKLKKSIAIQDHLKASGE